MDSSVFMADSNNCVDNCVDNSVVDSNNYVALDFKSSLNVYEEVA